MALIPDLAAHGLSFMHFFFHMEGGLKAVETFWAARGVPTSEWIGLTYFEVGGLSSPLTVSIQWRRAAKDCCDLRLALDAALPNTLGYPADPAYQTDEQSFKDFLNLARQQNVGGILSRYGAILKGNLQFVDLPESARLKRIVIEAGHSPSTITADFSRTDDGWIVTLEPEKLLKFLDKPVDDEFFVGPLKTATILITPILTDGQYAQPVAT